MFRLAHPRPLRAVCSQPVQLRNVSRALSRFTGYSWYVDNSDVSIVCTQLKRINCNSLPEVTCDDNYRVTNAFCAISWDKLEEFLHMQKSVHVNMHLKRHQQVIQQQKRTGKNRSKKSCCTCWTIKSDVMTFTETGFPDFWSVTLFERELHNARQTGIKGRRR